MKFALEMTSPVGDDGNWSAISHDNMLHQEVGRNLGCGLTHSLCLNPFREALRHRNEVTISLRCDGEIDDEIHEDNFEWMDRLVWMEFVMPLFRPITLANVARFDIVYHIF